MTIDEAIEVLQQDIPCERDTDLIEAIEMAIKALEQEPSGDCISRQAVHDMIEGFIADATSHGISARLDPYYVMNGIKYLPSVNLQEKTGHWEWVQYDSNPNIGNWHCSECRAIILHMPEETDNTPIYKWCPMCGARMVEPQESEEKE